MTENKLVTNTSEGINDLFTRKGTMESNIYINKINYVDVAMSLACFYFMR
jgi:hypothetical protein